MTLAITLLLISSCVREGEILCSEEFQEAALYIKVVDIVTGEDISMKEEVGVVDLFIFDMKEVLLDHKRVPSEYFVKGVPIPVKCRRNEGIYVSAWGNLYGSQRVSDTPEGIRLSELMISLNSDEDGYSYCPDDLFFGFKQINYPEALITRTNVIEYQETIPIARINARLHITVRGLPVGCRDDDYYFTVNKKNSGYDFRGKAINGKVEIKQAGIFNHINNDFVTREAFNIIHCSSDDESIIINLYQNDGIVRATEVPIASVELDSDGKRIAPAAGMTTNILIELGSSIDASVEITPWNRTYKWVKW